MLNQLKTVFFISSLTGLLMLIGGITCGINGIIGSFIIASFINFISYFYSDKIILNMYNVEKLDEKKYSDVYNLTKELSSKLNIEMPKLYYVNIDIANAFATGRNPKNSSIVFYKGILDILDQRELKAVISHELSHIANKDILISTIAATLAMAISFIFDILRRRVFFDSISDKSKDNDKKNIVGFLSFILVSIFLPIITLLIRLAISRSREYFADECGAQLCNDPLALASALEKLHVNLLYQKFSANDFVYNATSHLFIVNPFNLSKFSNLFSSHPPLNQRIIRLKKIYENKFYNQGGK